MQRLHTRFTMPFTQLRRPTHGSWAALARLALCSLVAKGAAGNERCALGNERCSIDVKIIGADGLRNSDFGIMKKPDTFVTVDVPQAVGKGGNFKTSRLVQGRVRVRLRVQGRPWGWG